jgi:hypothetical protein
VQKSPGRNDEADLDGGQDAQQPGGDAGGEEHEIRAVTSLP